MATLALTIGAAAALGVFVVLPPACNRDQDVTASDSTVVDLATLPADQVVGMVLRECHTDLGGMDRFAASVSLPGGESLQVFAHLPDRLRAQFADGAVQILANKRAQRLVAGTQERHDLSADGALRLRALCTLLDVAALGPLHRAIGCTRTGERTFALAQPGGGPWQLTLRPRSLLVEQLGGPDGTVQITDHKRTSTTWIVREAAIEPLGTCQVRFDSIDVGWDDSLFAPAVVDDAPGGDATATGTASPRPQPAGASITIGGAPRPRVPTLESTREVRWLVVDDPIDWAQRAAVVQRHVRELQSHGQGVAGFQGLLLGGERARLVIPFRANPGQPRFEAPAGWDIRDIAAGRALVVFPEVGDLPQRIAEGERLLQRALAEQDLSPVGAVLAQPYLHLDEATPSAKDLVDPAVRVSIPVR